jgi:hypothetical protein
MNSAMGTLKNFPAFAERGVSEHSDDGVFPLLQAPAKILPHQSALRLIVTPSHVKGNFWKRNFSCKLKNALWSSTNARFCSIYASFQFTAHGSPKAVSPLIYSLV